MTPEEIEPTLPERVSSLEQKLQDALNQIAKLEEANRRLSEELVQADACPDCGGRPGMLCGTCMGTGRKSGGRKQRSW